MVTGRATSPQGFLNHQNVLLPLPQLLDPILRRVSFTPACSKSLLFSILLHTEYCPRSFLHRLSGVSNLTTRSIVRLKHARSCTTHDLSLIDRTFQLAKTGPLGPSSVWACTPFPNVKIYRLFQTIQRTPVSAWRTSLHDGALICLVATIITIIPLES